MGKKLLGQLLLSGIIGIALGATGCYALVNKHYAENQVSQSRASITSSSTGLQAQTQYQQKAANEMTTTQKTELHELLTRDTKITDYAIYSSGDKGLYNKQILSQMESDFKEFEGLFPARIKEIQSTPDHRLEHEDLSDGGISMDINGDNFTSDLTDLYLAYQAALWTMHPFYETLPPSMVDKNLVHIFPPYVVPGIFSEYNRLLFGGKVNPTELFSAKTQR